METRKLKRMALASILTTSLFSAAAFPQDVKQDGKVVRAVAVDAEALLPRLAVGGADTNGLAFGDADDAVFGA